MAAIFQSDGNDCVFILSFFCNANLWGHADVVSLLILCPSLSIDARNDAGVTPLMKAALQGRVRCTRLLLLAGIISIILFFFFSFFLSFFHPLPPSPPTSSVSSPPRFLESDAVPFPGIGSSSNSWKPVPAAISRNPFPSKFLESVKSERISNGTGTSRAPLFLHSPY